MDDNEVTIIENSRADRDTYGHGYGSSTVVITPDHIKALRNGKALAIPINGGEYVNFLAMRIPEGCY